MQEDPLTLAISALTPEAQQQVQLTDLAASNDDLLRFCRMILSNFVHARSCQHARLASPADDDCECTVCESYISLVSHLQADACTNLSCPSGVPDCTCFSASAILAHFLRCEDSACILCSGFSKTIDDPPAPSVSGHRHRQRARTYAGDHAALPAAAQAPMMVTETVTEQVIMDLRRQLFLLHHAQTCQDSECEVEHCREAKTICVHLRACQTPTSCQLPNCQSFRRLLYHYANCTSDECQVCAVLRNREELNKTEQLHRSSSSAPLATNRRPSSDFMAAQDLLLLNRGGSSGNEAKPRTSAFTVNTGSGNPRASVDSARGASLEIEEETDMMKRHRKDSKAARRHRAMTAPQPAWIAPSSSSSPGAWVGPSSLVPPPLTPLQPMTYMQPPGYYVVNNPYGAPMLMPSFGSSAFIPPQSK